MRKWILLVIPLSVWVSFTVAAQDQVGCTQLLEDAKEAYAAGMVELVPELLVPCIEAGLTGAPRVEAYKLVITAYLFDYLPDEADSLMSDFLDENPDYRVQTSDQAEFVQLLEVHKQQREEAAAALAAAELERQRAEFEARKKAEEEARLLKQARRSKSGNTDSPRMGLVVGFNSTKPQVLEPFSTGNPLEDNGSYSMGPGLLLGGQADFPLAAALDFSVELLFNRFNMNYSSAPYSFTSVEYKESHNRLQLPLSLAVYLNPYGQTRVYLRGGVVSDYLISASGYGSRSYTDPGTFQRDVELEKATITSSRSRLNLYGMLGLGVSIPLSKSFVFVETRYMAGLFQANLEENRYDSQDLIWLLYHVDSNFRINQLNLNIGISWNLN